MSLWINSPDIEARVRREAVIRGMTPADYAQHILSENLPPLWEGLANSKQTQESTANTAEPPVQPALTRGRGQIEDDPTLALFDAWELEDATDDPEELARRQQEGDELLANLAKNRLTFREVVLDDEAYD